MTNREQEQSGRVVSRHVTSEGILVYLRTPGGQLRARLLPWTGGDGIQAGSDETPARCA